MTKFKILIIEDNSSIALSIENILKEKGCYLYFRAKNKKDALQIAEQEKPDLVIADTLIQKKLVGVEIVKEVYKLFPIPVILLEDQGIKSEELESVLPLIVYLSKSIIKESLLLAIELLLNKKLLDQQEKKHKENLGRVLNSLNESVVVCENEIINYVNPLFEKTTGWSQDEVVGKKIKDVLILTNSNKVAVDLDSLSTNFTTAYYDIFLTIKDDKKILIEGHIAEDDNKKLYTFIDVTSKKRIEQLQEERDRQEHLQFIFQNMSSGIIDCTRKGIIRYMNPISKSLTGYLGSKGIGKKVDEVFKLRDSISQEQISLLYSVVDTGTAFEFRDNKEIICGNNEVIPVTGAVIPYKNKKGELGAIIEFFDNTEVVQARKIKQQNVELKKQEEVLAKRSTQQKTLIERLRKKISTAQISEREFLAIKNDYMEFLLSSGDRNYLEEDINDFCQHLFEKQISMIDAMEIHNAAVTEIATEGTNLFMDEAIAEFNHIILDILLQLSELYRSGGTTTVDTDIDKKDIPILFDATEEELTNFKQDAGEKLDRVINLILESEQQKDNLDFFNEIFRIAHTIKGNGAIIKHERLVLLTHSVETIFDLIRVKKITLNTELVEVILKALEASKKLLDELDTKKQSGEKLTPILQNLEIYHVKDAVVKNKTLIEEDIKKITELKKENYQVYKMTVLLDAGCAMPSVTGLCVNQEIESKCKIVTTLPDLESLDMSDTDTVFDIIFASKDNADELIVLAKGIIDVKDATVQIYKEPEVKKGLKQIKKEAEFVKIKTQHIDGLIGYFSDLINAKNYLAFNIKGLEDNNVYENLITNFRSYQDQTNELIDSLFLQIEKLRMVEINVLFQKFPKIVRDLAKKLKKKIKIELSGTEVEIDKFIIENLYDSFMHIIRNCVDHGIETPDIREENNKNPQGIIHLRAFKQESHVVIEIEDDGKGLNLTSIKEKIIQNKLCTEEKLAEMTHDEIVNCVFLPGFSTAKEVSDISGRGVGLDVVKNKINELGGDIILDSYEGKGTKFTFVVPPSEAQKIIKNVNKGLLIEINKQVFLLPGTYISKIINTNMHGFKTSGSEQQIALTDKKLVSYIDINNILYSESSDPVQNKLKLLIMINFEKKLYSFYVDKILAIQQFVLKDVYGLNLKVPYISGFTILGDNTLAQVLDIEKIIQSPQICHLK